MTDLPTAIIASQIMTAAARINDLALRLGGGTGWEFPVGTTEFPTSQWYAATRHDVTGRRNGGYAHTGLDLNVDVSPWGDVDRGQPVYAIADGMVYDSDYSNSYLGSIIIQVDHFGVPLWVRYWHIEFPLRHHNVGDLVEAGEPLGTIGNYRLGAGGDHLHLDMAWCPFEPHWWFTRHPAVEWANPTYVLKQHLDADLVDAMLRRD